MQPPRHNPCLPASHPAMPRLPLLFLSTLLALPASGGASGPQWRQGWGLAGTTPAAETRHDTRFVLLQPQARAGGHAARVHNLLAGPVQVRLRDAASGSEAAPAALLAAGEQRELLWRDGGADPVHWLLDAFPGNPAARPDDHLYRLPFDAMRVRVSQGFGGHYSHTDAQNRHAVDFPLAAGTPVLAARAGTVMQAVDDAPDDGSLLRVLHADGSMAVYAHLQTGSFRVRPGQRVEAGQTLARSGNSGRSSGPHLHFAVQANTGLALVSIPFRMAGPRGELRFPRDDTP
ncbi:Peptidase M23 [uncultured Stenotrophomonas sp.]|uniref:Peptidase M23 n=1 Tax=uncultured Stenotrophomonas sp. TaxID=165438 RepID=A0A1Y5Q2T3_9GAMM|nr:Peptidase M23 [uncultured Stenotrophomonas sp.]